MQASEISVSAEQIYANALSSDFSVGQFNISTVIGSCVTNVGDALAIGFSAISTEVANIVISPNTTGNGYSVIGSDFAKTWSHNPTDGRSHLIDAGISSVNRSGFFYASKSIPSTYDNSELGTFSDLVPDSSRTANNMYVSSVWGDNFKWILGKDSKPGSRVWSVSKNAGIWGKWRSFAWTDDIQYYGIGKSVTKPVS